MYACICVGCCVFCRLRGDVKCWLNDYQGALEDLNTSNLLKPNDTFTLRYSFLYVSGFSCLKFSNFANPATTPQH
jgi:hypothetical protein